MRRITLAASALALSMLAAPVLAQQSPSNPPPPPAQPTTMAMPFLQLAGESDVYEITSSQMAVQRTTNPEIKAFAEMLIQHHTETSNMAMMQAKAAGLTPPPPVLGPQKRAMIDQLAAAAPADFDRVYLSQQVPAHEQALALMQTYASSGDTPQLRTAAAGAVPIVTEHLAQARRLQMGR
jgi:putative membrane protein